MSSTQLDHAFDERAIFQKGQSILCLYLCHKIGNLKYYFNISYLPSTQIKNEYYVVETWCLIRFSMSPVPTFPHLFHLITELPRWKEALLQICEPWKSMHWDQPRFLLPVQDGQGERPGCAGLCLLSPLLLSKAHSPHSKKDGPVLVTWWKPTNSAHTLGELVLDTVFNRPPDGHIKAKGLL